MSRENVDVVQALVAAAGRGDWDVALRAYDPSVELDVSSMPGGGVYSGHDGVRTFFRQWFGAWDQLRVTPEEFIDSGDQVVVILRISGVGKGSGVATSIRTADVMTVRGGKVIRHVGYLDPAEALEAVGLPEHD